MRVRNFLLSITWYFLLKKKTIIDQTWYLSTCNSLPVTPLSLSLSLSLSLIFFLDFMSRIAVIWISSPELSYVCRTFAMPLCAPMWAEIS